MEGKMNQYEAMFLFRVKDAKEDWDGLVEHVGGLITSASGTVKTATRWEERKLAYDIRGQSRAVYILVYFDAPPTAIDTIRQKCKLSDRVLRVLIVKDDGSAHYEGKVEEDSDGVSEQGLSDRESDEGSGA